jgi:hypothetical protein
VPKLCSIDGCGGKHYGKGWCNKHWNRWHKHGDPLREPKGVRLCSIEGCNRKHLRNGFCNMHDIRNKKFGDPHYKAKAWNGDLKKWLQDVAIKYKGDGCILWPFATIPGGYGRFKENGKTTAANRWICEQTHGPSPTDTHEAAHSCGNGRCLNPKHLRWATPKENTADKIVHGTLLKGSMSPSSRLTEDQVKEIRQLYGSTSQTKIAELFGVANQTISSIINGQTWGWLK